MYINKLEMRNWKALVVNNRNKFNVNAIQSNTQQTTMDYRARKPNSKNTIKNLSPEIH